MAKVWTYIPLWKSRSGALETSNTPFSDWNEFCAEYGATEADAEHFCSGLHRLLIRCEHESGNVTYEEYDAREVSDQLARHRLDEANPPLFPAFNL